MPQAPFFDSIPDDPVVTQIPYSLQPHEKKRCKYRLYNLPVGAGQVFGKGVSRTSVMASARIQALHYSMLFVSRAYGDGFIVVRIK